MGRAVMVEEPSLKGGGTWHRSFSLRTAAQTPKMNAVALGGFQFHDNDHGRRSWAPEGLEHISEFFERVMRSWSSLLCSGGFRTHPGAREQAMWSERDAL